MSGLTSTGFVSKTLEEILADIKARLRSSYGSGVDTDTDSVVMVTLLPVILELVELWQGSQGQYDFFNKLNAEGISLDNLGAIINVPRLSGAKSTVDAQVIGTVGSVIPINFIRSVEDTNEPFQTLLEITTTSDPQTISMSALNDGPVASVAETLNQGTLPSGITSMTNLVDAIVGTFDETDEEYRIGLGTRLSALGAGTVVSIKAALLTIPLVVSVTVFENDTGTDNFFGNGLPAHSIRALVEIPDGETNDQNVWDTLGIKKGAGTFTDGDEVGTFTDPVDQQEFTMRFSRPALVSIFVDVVVTSFDSDIFSPGTDLQKIEDAILVEGNTFQLGDDVTLPRLQSAVTSVPGIITYTLFFDTSATPLVDATIVIASGSKADFDSTRTSVTEPPP